jgi:hypothetical protein
MAKVRGLYLVLKTEGNNGSSVYCRNVHDDTVEIIHAQDLFPIDLRAIESADEIMTLAAGLKSVPEYIVTEISDHRYTATMVRPSSLQSVDLESLSFLCLYSGLPAEESSWWNQYKDVKHLTLLKKYLDEVNHLIPQTLANGKSFEDATVSQLRSFAKHYNISILHSDLKQNIILKIQIARTEAQSRLSYATSWGR